MRAFNRDVRLYLLTSALFGFAVFGGIYSTLLNLYLLRLGYGPEFAGLLNGAGQLVFGLCALPVGLLGQRWGSRRMLIIGFSLIALGYGLLPLAEFTPVEPKSWLISAQIIAQTGVAFYFVNGAPFVMTIALPQERDHVIAASIALWPLTGFVGSLAGGLLPGLFALPLGVSLNNPAPYRIALFLGAALMLPAVWAIMKTRRAPDATPTAPIASPKTPMPLKIITLMFVVVLFRVMGEGMVRTFLNIYLDAALQMPVAQIGALLATGQLLAIPAAMAMPLFAARWGVNATYIYSSWGIALSFLPLAFAPHWLGAGLGYMGIIALTSIARPTIVSAQMEAVPPRWRTIMTGATSAAVGVGWAAASLSGGYIVTAFGYSPLFLSGAMLTVVSVLVFLLYHRKPQGKLI